MYQPPYNFQQPAWPVVNPFQPAPAVIPPNPPSDSTQFPPTAQNVFQPAAVPPGFSLDPQMAYHQQQGMFMQNAFSQQNTLQQPWVQPTVNPFNPATTLQPFPQAQQWNPLTNQWVAQPQSWDQSSAQYQPPQVQDFQGYQPLPQQLNLFQPTNTQASNTSNIKNDAQSSLNNAWSASQNQWMQNSSYQTNVQQQNIVSTEQNTSNKQWVQPTTNTVSAPTVPPPPSQNPPLPNEPPPPQNPPSSIKAPPPPDHPESKSPAPPEEDQESLISLTKQLETLETQIKTYQAEYQKWHLDFVKWQKQHQNHPDQKQYIDYQKQYQKIIEEQQTQLKQQYAELQKKISLRKAQQEKKNNNRSDQLSKEINSSQGSVTGATFHQAVIDANKASTNTNQSMSGFVQASPQSMSSFVQASPQSMPLQKNLPQHNLTPKQSIPPKQNTPLLPNSHIQQNTSQPNKPQQSITQQSITQQSIPQQNIPQQNTSQQNIPQQSIPQQSIPQQSIPQQNILQQNIPPLMQQQIYENKRPGFNNPPNESVNKVYDYKNQSQKPVSNQGHLTSDQSKMLGNQPQHSGPFGQAPENFGQPNEPYGQHPEPRNHPPGAYGQPPGAYGQPPGAYGQPPGTYGQPPRTYGQPPGPYGQPPGPYGQPPPNFRDTTGNQGMSGYPPHLVNQPKLPENQNRFGENHNQFLEKQNENMQFNNSHEQVHRNSGHFSNSGNLSVNEGTFKNQNQLFNSNANHQNLNAQNNRFENPGQFQGSFETQKQVSGNQLFQNQGQMTPDLGQRPGTPRSPWLSRQLQDNQGHMSGNPRPMHNNQMNFSGNKGEVPGNHQQITHNWSPMSNNQKHLPDNQKSPAVNQGQQFNNQGVDNQAPFNHGQSNNQMHNIPKPGNQGQSYNNQFQSNQKFLPGNQGHSLNSQVHSNQQLLPGNQGPNNRIQNNQNFLPGNQEPLNNQLQNNQKVLTSNQGQSLYNQVQNNQKMLSGNQGQPLNSQVPNNQKFLPGNQGQPLDNQLHNQKMLPGNQGQLFNNQLQTNQKFLPGNQGQPSNNLLPNNQKLLPGNQGQMLNNQVNSNQKLSDNQGQTMNTQLNNDQKLLPSNQGQSNNQIQNKDNRQISGNQGQTFGNQNLMVDHSKSDNYGRVTPNQVNQKSNNQGNNQKSINNQGSISNDKYSENCMPSQGSGNKFEEKPPINEKKREDQGRFPPSYKQMSSNDNKNMPNVEENSNQTKLLNQENQSADTNIGDNQSKGGNKNELTRPGGNSTSGIIIRPANEYKGAKCKFFPRCKMGKECKFEHPMCASLKCIDPACPFEHPIGRDVKAASNEGPISKTNVQKPELPPFAMGSIVSDIQSANIAKRVYPKSKHDENVDFSKDDIPPSLSFSPKQNISKPGPPPAKLQRADNLLDSSNKIAERVEEIYEKRKREIFGLGPDQRNEFQPVNTFVSYEERKREIFNNEPLNYEQRRREMFEGPMDYDLRKREGFSGNYPPQHGVPLPGLLQQGIPPPEFHDDFHDLRGPFHPRGDDRNLPRGDDRNLPRGDDRFRNLGPNDYSGTDDRFNDRHDRYPIERPEVIDYAHGGRGLDGLLDTRDNREPIWRSSDERPFHIEQKFDRGIHFDRMIEPELKHIDRFGDHGPHAHTLYQRDLPRNVSDYDFLSENERPREINDRLEMRRIPDDRYRYTADVDFSDEFYDRQKDFSERERYNSSREDDFRFNQPRDRLYDRSIDNYEPNKVDRHGYREPSTHMKRFDERDLDRNNRDDFRDYQMLYEKDNDDLRSFRDSKKGSGVPEIELKPEVLSAADILDRPGRDKRPRNIVIILRGIPGAGKSFVAKLIKDKESYYGAPAPRILVLDDYFMQEVEKTEIGPDKKTKLVKKQEYVYEANMEETYRSSLLKAFNKTLADGFFPVVIVDAINNKTAHFDQFWSDAKHKGFEVYIAEITGVVDDCLKRSVHKRSKDEVEKMLSSWEKPPVYYKQLDVSALLQDAAIDEVEMEEAVENTKQGEEKVAKQEEDDEELPTGFHIPKSSKWETDKEETLAKLDGITKRKNKEAKSASPIFAEDDDDDPYGEKEADMRLGKKRVRWVDIEEKKQIDHQRKIGFSIGMDWNILTDPNAQIPK
uniref:YLP motif-containing protein 1 n=1 Tax=Hydra vulgaris TaxID=6087 RepID=T2MFH0_HYDVU